MARSVLAVVALAANAAAAARAAFSVPSVPLRNAAAPGMTMPAVGLGTGGYGASPNPTCASYPQCWNAAAGCAGAVSAAVSTYLATAAGGGALPARVDNANTYADVSAVYAGINASGIPRSSVFLLSKVGSGQPMGYADTAAQIAGVLAGVPGGYLDALLIHWPTSPAPSTDPVCNMTTPATYNATACRLHTWQALVEVWQAGTVRAIGVSNYNVSELEEIVAAGMPVPSINQIPIHPYRFSSQVETIAWCAAHGVVVNAYSPLGVPDWHAFPAAGGMSTTPLVDPVVTAIAEVHGRTPAAVILAWLWANGIVTNPRSMNASHMADNLGAYDLALTDAEVALLSSRPQDWCSLDSKMYECAPDNIGPAVPHPWA
jgi:2,5-diketo-D-gluconate reductase A